MNNSRGIIYRVLFCVLIEYCNIRQKLKDKNIHCTTLLSDHVHFQLAFFISRVRGTDFRVGASANAKA